ncbi:ornithine cyclodeaminase family protein [Streptomyces sp. NPDC006872]|uniref:ornithine cyclodeaminase family protein n=1 Tax=Streptomyces sp. NPDC006872 TaxID=3155720 RepID=UPI0033C5A458
MSKVTVVGPEEIRSIVPMRAAIDSVRDAFVALSAGEFEMPIRTALRDGQFLVMSAHHRPSGTAMFKTLSLNFAGRQPAIAGTVEWSDVAHAEHLIADAGAVTSLRTGAASGVATDLLAPPGARNCVIIGAGAQAPDQIRAVHEVRPLSTLTIVDRDPARANVLGELLAGELPDTTIEVCADANSVVGGADIICCATTSTVPLFSADAVAPDTHVNAIGAFRPTMRELSVDLLARATVVVDERAAVLEESGEIIDAVHANVLAERDLAELGHVLVAGFARSRVTVFKTVGIAIQDWAIARALSESVLMSTA